MIIGLTGQSGAGKSTVSKVLAMQAGFAVIDCDGVAREVTADGSLCNMEIGRHFPEMVLQGFVLDRQKTAQIVFSDKNKLREYESIIYPYITQNVNELISLYSANGYQAIILDAPTLFEAGMDSICDMVIGVIADNYRTRKTDLTVLLTHIGIEADRELAKLLDPEWGVDLIIGGHSHTFMEKPEVVNGIPIVQAGTGTGQIGRFELTIDTRKHKPVDYKWECVPINEDTAPTDPVMDELLDRYQNVTDAKYKRVVTTFARTLTHPTRIEETELGNLYADLLQWESSFDIMIMGTGAIRKKELGPIVEYQDMLENTPFDDVIYMLKVTGKQFRAMIQHIFRDEAWEGHTEFYNYSKGVKITYQKSTHTFKELSFNGKEIEDADELLVAIQAYHFNNFDEFFGVPLEEVSQNMKPRVVATSVNNIIEEYFSTNKGLDSHVEGRIEVLE